MRNKLYHRKMVSISAVSLSIDSKLKLCGTELVPNTTLNGHVAIILHGYSSNTNRVSYLATSFVERGIPTILMNLRGHSNSDGDSTDINQMQNDLDLLIEYIKTKDYYKKSIILVGVSLGGLIALTSGQTKPEITHIIGLAVISSPRDFVEGLGPLRTWTWKMRSRLGGLDLFKIQDNPQFIPAEYFKNYPSKKIYLIHCLNDRLVHVRNFWKNVSLLELKEKNYHLFIMGGHNLLFQKRKINKLILNWIQRDL